MKNVRKTLAYIGLASAILIAPAFAKDSLERRAQYTETRVYYEIDCSFFHVGDGYYSMIENDEDYEIKMEAWAIGFFKFLGLKYEFSTEGYKEEGELYPIHFRRVNKGKEKKGEGPKKIEVTDAYFDYENLEARGYAYKEIDGEMEVKWDTMDNPAKITKDVKDFLTIIEELKRNELKDAYEFKTIAKGKVHSFQIKKIGEEIINLNKEDYKTVVYETEVHKSLFGVDSKAKIWVHKEADHTLLKCWVENGPLWTSVNLNYSGSKAGLRQ